ncbi:RING finger protein 17 [Harpegnathos saltator]|uniref:RING finger protein 17 n=1 Tax=Harpegnathos saltator TaxID=610380 RepID=E2BR77_HARSA|nr:RING finger protein 17 [Harpegnathos saltator]
MIITKHFARLHGVLQNLEAELMNQLQQRRNSLKNNLAEVEVQLRAHEEQLNIAVTMASYAANNFDKVDMRNAIKVLSEMADLPCHVIRNNYIEDEAMSFTIDEEIIPLMENHCTLQVPQVSRYQLVRTEVLPEDYVLEPVAKDFIGKDVNKHQVEVTHIVSPSLFFVRYLSSKAKFIQLEKDLQAYAETCENNSVELQQDDMCVVKQLVKYSWNRGRVIAVNTSNSFETTYDIFYIDYGYKEQHVTNSRIWNIKDEHLKLKPQAIQCCLHGIVPLKNTWTNKSTKDFIKLLRDVSVFMHIVKHNTDILHVDICTTSSKDNSMGPQSICNAMIFMKHARSNTSTAQMRLANIAYAYQREELMLNKVTSVVITHVKSPAKIYVSKKGQRQVEYMKLLDELNEYCENNTEPPIISTPKEGLPCIAQYLDDIWHRCEIVKIISKDEVEVFYVDLGHTITLSCDLLRMIPYKYTQYKAQAIRIALMYVSPDPDGKWKTEAIDTLSNIFDGVISVNVIPRKKINDGYVGCMNLAGISDEEETIKDPFKMEVCIKRLVTPDCIYVAQTDHKESNENLITAMQQFYNSYCSEARDNWAENALCAVYSAKDKSYFRAQILKIKSPTEVLVYFCDIGIDETVTMKDIQVLHPKFTKQPAHCFKVKLAGILPCGGSSIWPSLSCSTLTDIIRTNSRCKFYITKLVQQETCDNVIPVELWVKQIKIPGPLAPSKVEINSVNRMLVENGVALPIKDYFSKTDSVLVLEFKRQLLNSHRLVSSDEQNDIQWINKNACRSVNCKIDDSSTSSENELLDQNISAGISEKKLDCSKMQSDWLPPVEIVEEVFHAIPTYVDNDGAVYLHSLKQKYKYLSDMKIKIEPKEWNNAIHEEKAPDSTSSSVRNSAVEEITDNVTIADTSQKSLKSETQEVMLKENVISGTLAETAEESKYNDDKGLTDFQNISWPDIFIADDFVISSTPQNESLEEENFFSGYKSLSIPQDTKYIEVILCCNINSTTSYAQLAENDDDIFSHVLHDYYLQYEAIMLDIQKNASSRPLIKFFKNYTPCIAKFTDDQWYRCIITQSEKSSDNQSVDVMLHYIDYGNNEHKMLDLSIENHDLRVPKQEWIEVPAMAIECKFWNLEFVSDDIDLLASQLDKIYNTAVVARVKEIRDNMMVAEIYEDKTCQKLLYAHLIDEGLYQYKKSKDD